MDNLFSLDYSCVHAICNTSWRFWDSTRYSLPVSCCLCVYCFDIIKECVYHDFIYALLCFILSIQRNLRLCWFLYCFTVLLWYLFVFGCFPWQGFETGLIFSLFYCVYVIFIWVLMFPIDRNRESLDYLDIYHDLICTAVIL